MKKYADLWLGYSEKTNNRDCVYLKKILLSGAPEQDPAAQHNGQNDLHQIADQNQNTGLKAQSVHDVCHTGVAGVADFGAGLSGVMPGNGFRCKKTAEGVTDQAAEDPRIHTDPSVIVDSGSTRFIV